MDREGVGVGRRRRGQAIEAERKTREKGETRAREKTRAVGEDT
jgi:hypothetical protein